MSNAPLFIKPQDRVSLNIRNLSVKLKQKDIEESPTKLILNDVSFDLNPGKVLGILGSSGSGKTTLLNTLSSRMHNSPFEIKGMIKFNYLNSYNLSYLVQEDLFIPGLKTVEMLNYTALLKLPNSTQSERTELVDFLINSLHLSKVRDVIIADFKGDTTLSGGEKRRVSLALQLLTKPSILFLDEPTTGLDATTSSNLISMIKQLSLDFGITVILTIHQPRIEILQLFDEICLLAKGGSMLYYGDLHQGANYFQSLDNETFESDLVNDEANFADFLLKVSSVDKYSSLEVELKTEKRVKMLIDSWKRYQIIDEIEYIETMPDSSKSINRKLISFREIYILFRRTILLTYRDMKSIFMLWCVTTVVALIVGWLFYKPPGTLAGIRSITSALYVCCEILGFTPFVYEIERLCSQDGKFLIKEYRQDKLYSLSSWFIGRRLAKMLIEDAPISMIWSIITYFMWGLEGSFGIFFINNMLVFSFGIACAHCCFVIGDYQFGFASLICGLFYQFQNAASGYFINAKSMPVYVRWTKYLAPFWYTFGSLTSNNFTGYFGDCTGDNCTEYTGEYILDTLGYPEKWYIAPLISTSAFYLGTYIVSAILIWYKCKYGNIKTVKARKSKTKYNEVLLKDTIEGKEDLTKERYHEDISLSIRNISLSLKPNFIKNSLLRRQFNEKELLKNLSIEFKPGLSAIMGPSGSGKTTLLNLISGRTNFRNFSKQGDVILNDCIVPFNKLSRLVSYVVQDDSYLIPVLTVRETLYYQAKLRLKKSRHGEINQIIHQLMKQMGLLDVMNLPIGDYITKGISGGEKRRLSVAIQLLNEDQKILLLDEPTSGLDSFTSENLVSLLKELATSYNKIIIMTIHQPKFEIFKMFDKIVLLKDGNLIFDGETVNLIESVHFDDSNDINFADYLMDVLSGGQNAELRNIKEKSTQYIPISIISTDYQKYSILFQQKKDFSSTFLFLWKREIQVILRTDGVLVSRIGQFIGLAIIHGLFFAPLRNNSAGISNRLGLIQEVMNLYAVGLFNNMSLYPYVKTTFYQEYQDNLYSPLQFILIYTVNELPIEFISNFILSVFLVLVIGLPRNAEMFFSMWYMCLLCVNCGESIGIMVNSIFDHLGIAMNILSNILSIGIFMGGVMSLNMPSLFKALNYISPLRYAVLALAKLGFENQVFQCTGSVTDCTLNTGQDVLDQYNLNSTFWVNFVVIAAITVIYRLIALLVIQVKVSYK